MKHKAREELVKQGDYFVRSFWYELFSCTIHFRILSASRAKFMAQLSWDEKVARFPDCFKSDSYV